MQVMTMLKAPSRTLAAAVVAGVAAITATFMPSAAQAQRAGDDYFPSNVWQAGGAVAFTPRFEGSNRYKAIAFPIVAPAGLGGDDGFLQIRNADDVRFRLLKWQGFEFGALAGYRGGRDSSDSAKLAGFADIDAGLVVGGFGGYRIGNTLLSVSYHRQVTGEDTGGVVRLLAEQTMRLDKRTTLVASIGTNIADKDYMQTFFGVSAAQAGALPLYTPAAGFKDVFGVLKATFELDRQWTLTLMGQYSRLVGDAANSPVIDTANQFSGGAGLTYKFDLGR
jgi:outer membrane protein